MKLLQKNLKCALRSLDLFGYNVQLFINMDTKVKSKFGGFISIVIFIYSCYFFASALQSWYTNNDFQIIPSMKNLSLNQIYQQNETILYDFDYSNYNIYFILLANLPNSTSLNFRQLENYVSQQLIYNNLSNYDVELPFNNCLTQRQEIFLLETVDVGDNATSPWSICLNQTLQMGLAADPQNLVNAPMIKYRILLCENTTDNNYSCASSDEITQMLQYIQVQIRLPETDFDFNDNFSPRKRTYDYEAYHLDMSLYKYFLGYLMPVFLETDRGLFQEDYVLDSVDFNAEKITSESMMRSSTDSILLEYALQFGTSQQFYYRKNSKIYQILGNLGGIINLLLLIGGVICKSYNSLVLKYELINQSFENLEEKEKVLNKY